MDATVQKVTEDLEALIYRYGAQHERLRTSNPTLPETDIRFGLYSLISNTLATYLITLKMMDHCLLRGTWWTDNVKGYSKLELRQGQFDQSLVHWKVGTFLLCFSYFEAALRRILRLLSPGACGNGLAAYQSVYVSLLSTLNLQQHEPTLRFARLIRNQVHNNGIYINKDSKSETVIFEGKTYTFKHDLPIEFGSLNVFFTIYDRLLDLSNDLNAHPEIAKLPYSPMH